MNKGIFCLSIDLELLWGRAKNPKPYIPYVKKERVIIKKLLCLLKKYEIPTTWAIVGKLLDDGNPLWYGKDIIEMIRKTKNQEIACHTFSHKVFDEKILSPKDAKTEIDYCLKIGRQHKIKLLSFVFPFNIVGHLKILKDAGFLSFRGVEPYWFEKIPLKKLKKFLQIIDFLFLFSPPVSQPLLHTSGLINIPGSMYFVSNRGLRRFVPTNFRFLKAKRGLEKAVKTKSVFHLWFHPLDFAKNTPRMLAEFEKIIKYAIKLRKENNLEIKSMGEIAISCQKELLL